LLVAGFADMVRLFITLDTEVLLTGVAPDSVFCHMLGGFMWDRLTLVIFLALDDFTSLHEHDIFTSTALNEIRVYFDDVHWYVFFNCLLLFFGQKLHQLVRLNLVVALWAVYVFILGKFRDRHLSKAIDVDLVEALWGLKHGHIHFCHFLLRYLLVTEFTKTIFFLLLNLLVVSSCSLSLAHIHESLNGISVKKLVLLLLDLVIVVKGVRHWRGWNLAHVVVRLLLFFD
jgi:hypothetical protein